MVMKSHLPALAHGAKGLLESVLLLSAGYETIAL
jgi:hypothetical protein